MGNVRRIYVEKKAPFAVKAQELQEELKNYLGINDVEEVRVFIRYDVENISDEVFAKACKTVFKVCVSGYFAGKILRTSLCSIFLSNFDFSSIAVFNAFPCPAPKAKPLPSSVVKF